MATRNYPRLGIEEFGTHLLDSGDIDPLYIALVEAELDEDLLKRWLLAYWCLYSAGEASFIAEARGEAFFDRLHAAALNKLPSPIGERWKRGHERRHWRGANAKVAVEDLRANYEECPEDFVNYVACLDRPVHEEASCAGIVKRVREHCSFGPWIGFKVADMVERVLGWSVSFDQAEVFVFDSPREAAQLLYFQESPEGRKTIEALGPTEKLEMILGKDASNMCVKWSVDYLRKMFGNRLAPPTQTNYKKALANQRVVGLQEVETILCKWKSHRNGHYPLNNDIVEIRAGLEPWLGKSKTAAKIYAAMPRPLVA